MPTAVMPESEVQIEEGKDGAENLPSSDEARDGLNVDRSDREEQRRRQRRRRRYPDSQKERREEQGHAGMQEKVDGVEREGLLAMDPPLDCVGKQEHGPVDRAGAPRATEVGRGEDPGHVGRRADPRVVANDRLVVVGEVPAEAVGVREDARGNQQSRAEPFLSLRQERCRQEPRV